MKMSDWKLNDRLKIENSLIERSLNFSTIPQEEDELCYSRRKVARQDPMSHRIIEKRRRDRMNNCLADLSRLIPHQYMKKSRGRIEKTEIIEMAIRHLKHLQAHSCKDLANCEVAKATEQEWQHQYRLGFQECTSEAVRFLVESEGLFPAEGICFRLLAHLQEHYEKLSKGCYPNGRGGPQLGHEDSNSTQMEVENTNIHNGSTGDNFTIKRTTSPSPYDVQVTDPPQQSQIQDYEPQTDEPCRASASQLREMLQNPSITMERIRSNSASSTTSNYAYSSRPYLTTYDNYPKGQTCEEVYKFKNNIKDRFNADLSQQIEETPVKFPPTNNSMTNTSYASFSTPVTKCLSSASTNLEAQPNHNNELKQMNEGDLNNVNGQNDPQTDSSNGSSSPVSNGHSNGSSSGYSTSGDVPNKMKMQVSRSQSPEPGIYTRRPNSGRPNSSYLKPTVIPIFALHPKGNFYIPMTVESGLLAPYMYCVDNSVPVLHPVSISVNFCGPVSEHTSWLSQQNTHNTAYDRFRDQNY